MNAEIASEMMRSRSQTPHPDPIRASGSVFRDGATTGEGVQPRDGAVASTAEANFGSGELSGMRLYCIQKPSGRKRVVPTSGLQ